MSFGEIALFGAAIATGGIAQMMAPSPGVATPDNRERPEERPSFMLNQFVNRSEEGAVVPVAYGEDLIVGTHVVNGGISTKLLSQTEIVDVETEFESFHNMNSQSELIFDPRDIPPEPETARISMRGFNRMKWFFNPGPNNSPFHEATQPEPSIGNFDDLVFRNAQVLRVSDYHLDVAGLQTGGNRQRFEIVLGGVHPQDFFVQVTVVNFADTVVYAGPFLAADADIYAANSVNSGLAWTYRWSDTIWTSGTRWIWEEGGSSPNFKIPDDEVMKVKFEYD